MQGIDHYENFPVASWCCPPRLRAPVQAIYRYARTADDLADEGPATPTQRLADLHAYRTALLQTWRDPPGAAQGPWPEVFVPLAGAARTHHLPQTALLDLLDAFEQDVRHTAQGLRYAHPEALLDYCQRSANPIGRLMLHLYGVTDALSLRQSDAICSALQLINFWQDLRVDLARQRHYLPDSVLQQHGLEAHALTPTHDTPAARAMLQALCEQARSLMLSGAPLALRLPGRIGWELRLVVQGGLRIVELLQRNHYRAWQQRPALRTRDALPLLWRAVRMPAALNSMAST